MLINVMLIKKTCIGEGGKQKDYVFPSKRLLLKNIFPLVYESGYNQFMMFR